MLTALFAHQITMEMQLKSLDWVVIMEPEVIFSELSQQLHVLNLLEQVL